MTNVDYSNRTIWGIHGGRTGDADSIFLKKDQMTIGWVDMGDLGKLAASRDAFKARMQEVIPDKKPGYYPMATGQVFRFVHEVKEGDLVIYPSKRDRHVHIGEIVGGYTYVEKNSDGYPNRRAVKWIKDFPRTRFSQGALYEIGSAMSFFQVKNYADEFLAALSGQSVSSDDGGDDTASYVAEEIEQNTRDFILKVLAQELKGHGFAEFVGHLLNTMGYRTRVAPPGPDGGVDIIAHRDELGFEPPIIKVQVKSSEGSIGNPEVSQLIGTLDGSEFGLFIALGTFTNPARNTARNKSNLRLIDGDELVNLVLTHYEQFDSKYKGMLPLKRVYVPEPLEE